MNKYYITTAIPYVNAKPHIGHALEFAQTDAFARYHQLLGKDVMLLSGADENALKNVQAAEDAGMEVQAFVDQHADEFEELLKNLNINVGVYQKGSNQETHYPSAQKLWELCQDDIYKETYSGMYCVGCEAFYAEDELVSGECPEHPGKPLEEVSEENYFFALGRYQEHLIQVIESDELQIIPESRKNEILGFLKEPLQDISISRSNERAKNWGVPVPGDDTQRMYVWFDALNIYQSGIGFGWDDEGYKKWWPADCHVIGKGILRFHAVYWPAFLLSAGLDLPKRIFVHGYITVDGQKMSKSIGNTVDPAELLETYGTEAVRYYFLSQIPATNDGDFSYDRFEDIYNAHLAGGIGNLYARVAGMTGKYFEGKVPIPSKTNEIFAQKEVLDQYKKLFEEYKVNEAAKMVFSEVIDKANEYVEASQPWELAKEEKTDELAVVMYNLLETLRFIAILYQPFLPETSAKILEGLGVQDEVKLDDLEWGNLSGGNEVKKTILFPRLEEESE